MIYFYIEGKRYEEAVYVCKALKIRIITTHVLIHEYSIREGATSILLNNRPRRFKQAVKTISPRVVILENDSTSPRGQWLAKNYKSYLLAELTVNTRTRYLARSRVGFLGSKHKKYMHRIVGMTGLLYGIEIDLHDLSLKTFLRLLRDKFYFDYQPVTALPGWYCDKVIVQNDEIRKLYLENNFRQNQVLDLGNPHEDYYAHICQSSPRIKNDIDVLLFSQPFYLRGFQNWIHEVGDLVDECQVNGLKLVIKLHPRDDINKYRIFEKKCTLDQSGGSSLNIVKLMQRSSLVVVKHSTVIILALLLKKPIAFIDYRKVRPFLEDEIDFLDDMILCSKGKLRSIFENSNDQMQKGLQHQKQKLSKIARFDLKSLGRLLQQLTEDDFMINK